MATKDNWFGLTCTYLHLQRHCRWVRYCLRKSMKAKKKSMPSCRGMLFKKCVWVCYANNNGCLMWQWACNFNFRWRAWEEEPRVVRVQAVSAWFGYFSEHFLKRHARIWTESLSQLLYIFYSMCNPKIFVFLNNLSLQVLLIFPIVS